MTKQQEDFNSFLTTQLNKQQLQAVQQEAGSLLVIAGAGSGKTRVITARIAHLLLNQHVLPSELIALTFTNKAAREMQERIKNFLGTTTNLPFIGTFHSYCLRLLKAHNHLLDAPFVSILDSDDQQKMLHDIIQRHAAQKQITAKKLAYQISHITNQKIDESGDVYENNRLLYDLHMAYEHEKRLSKCLDFDDLLLHTRTLFTNNKEFRANFQQTVRHLLVDEYQDTNKVQHELLKLIAQDSNKDFAIDSLCAVGDEDQSIYSWRGATVANIVYFKKDFPETNIITIEQNYRSVQPILTVANHVIQNNTQRNPKKLWSEKNGTDRIRGLSCLSEYQEGEAIAQLVRTTKIKSPRPSIAILYRTHFQSRALEEALIKNSVRYTIIGGIQFYERKEIKDILAYLKLLVNPFDRTSFFRVINCPTRGLGPKFEELCYERWNQEPFLTFEQLLNALIAEEKITGTKKTAVLSFTSIFKELTASATPSQALDQIIKKSAYIPYIEDSYDPEEARTRKENINELKHAIAHLEKNGTDSLQKLLDEIALMQAQSNDNDQTDDPVLLMTLHSAKGLEFDVVILAGLEEGLLPTSRSLNDTAALEEERRLFYVGITRAKEHLLFTHARYRYTYGSMNDQRPSSFVKEIPSGLVLWEDSAYWNTSQFEQYFALWLGIAQESPSAPVYTYKTARSVSVKKDSVKKPAPHVESPGGWKKHQPVSHTKFGTGIVQSIERKSDAKVYLTIKFRSGVKKIDAQFITTL